MSEHNGARPASANNGFHRSISSFSFFLVLDFWSAWATRSLPVLSLQRVNLTQALDGNLSNSDLPFLESHCNTVVVDEVDELEEDVR